MIALAGINDEGNADETEDCTAFTDGVNDVVVGARLRVGMYTKSTQFTRSARSCWLGNSNANAENADYAERRRAVKNNCNRH